MPFGAKSVKRPVSDRITELQRRIKLLERDRTAFYESSQYTIKKNKETIHQLREETNTLHKKLAAAKDGGNRVVKVACQNLEKGSEKDALRNMSVKKALSTLDQKLWSKKKRLNAQKHITQTLQQQLNEFNLEYERLNPRGGNSAAKSPDSRARKKEKDAMKLRTLENNFEKAQLKCTEAKNITRYYLTLKSPLQDESLTFSGQLDSLEAKILKHREELRNLQARSHEAQLSAEAKADLQQRKELLYKDRKERERYKAKVEREIQAERVERRMQRTAMQPDDLSSEPQRSTTRMAVADEKIISTFEDVFRRVKEATGVTDIREVPERFVTQKQTHESLENLMKEKKKVLAQLKEQKVLMTQEFRDKKYSWEAKLFKDQRILEERKEELQAAQRRCDEAKELVPVLDKTLSTVQAGVEHPSNTLQHITLRHEDTSTVVSTDSRLVALLSECEQKLQLPHNELQGKDVSVIMKRIEDEEFFLEMERKLPTNNTRVQLPEDQSQELDDEEESDEDEAGILSREALKRRSRLIVNSKLKKKSWKKR